jgi:hypothetical protein
MVHRGSELAETIQPMTNRACITESLPERRKIDQFYPSGNAPALGARINDSELS